MQLSATSRHHRGRPHPSPASVTGVDALRVDQGRRHRSAGSQAASSVEGANVCHRSPSDGDNRSSTNVACSHCGLEKGSTWGTSLTPTHTIAARMDQRWWRQCRQRYRRTAFAICAQRLRFNATRACDLTQRDGCDLLRTACAI